VLSGAVVHAAWNLLLAGARDSEAAGAVALASGAVIFAPVAIATWRIDADAIPYVVASSALELTYFVLLGRAYHRSELSLVYPIARGSAPVLVLIVSAILGTALATGQVIGILAVAAGILAIRGLKRSVHQADLLLALGIGASIAGYTLVDKEGLKHAAPLTYLWVVNAPAAAIYIPLLAWGRGSRLTTLATYVRNGSRPRAMRARVRSGFGVLRAAIEPRSLAAGAGVFGAYALTLAALQRAPAAPVAALRETGVLFATAFGAVVLHERVTVARALGAISVVAGTALIALA
jgi:drug/metabolite transporter (DMT)-like permease